MADTNFSNECFIYTGTKTKALDARIKGIKYDTWNFFYLRAFDKAGAKSAFTNNAFSDCIFSIT